MKLRKFFTVISIAILSIALLFMLVIGFLYVYAKNNTDSELDEMLFSTSKNGTVTRLYYNAGGEEEYIPREYTAITPGTEKKIWTSYNEISPLVKYAFIAAEDREFFNHPGFNFRRTVYALINSIFNITDKFGASTITQQVVKNISGDREQTFKRKLNEIIRAIKIEQNHSKEEILELYLNIVPMGDNISGVGLASEYYFGKSADELSVSEAATLAGITNAPAKYNPYTNLSESIKKRNSILYAMYECGYINKEEYESAKDSPLTLKDKQPITPLINSWFTETVCDDVCRDLVEKLSISETAARLMVTNGGLSIYTTVKPEVQAALENYFEDYSNFPEEINNGLDFSMIITDSVTGYVRGIVGNAGEKTANRILNYAEALHVPGSTLKPIALYAPLIDSKEINWATVFDDVPVKVTEEGGEYVCFPKNSPNVYDGLTTVSDAIRVSKNTIAVRLYEILGKEKIYGILRDNYGFSTLVRSERSESGRIITDMDVSPLALGQLSYGVSLRKLTEAYSVFPSYGELKPAKTYLSVFDSHGKMLISNEKESKRVLNAETAKIMNMLLMRVVDSGTAKKITLKETVDTAGKTGTSGADRDRLFIGYTPYYTAGIWCGYDGENKSIGALSVSHLEIWDGVMRKIHEYAISSGERVKGFDTEGLLYLPFCSDSGAMFTHSCLFDLRPSRLRYGYFTEDNKPNGACTVHVTRICDPVTKMPLEGGKASGNVVLISYLKIKERNLPNEIKVTDSEYILQESKNDTNDTPYNFSEEVYTEKRKARVRKKISPKGKKTA